MKTVQQVLGFVQGWQQAIAWDKDKDELDNNEVYQMLITIENYIIGEEL